MGLATDSGFGEGTYRLFEYAGTLIPSSPQFFFSVAPAGYNLTLDTTTTGHVNLQVDYTGLSFWNGLKTAADGTMLGGSGAWNTTLSNWTNETGIVSAVWENGLTAVFSGASGGAVDVIMDVEIAGLQFATDGYTLSGSGQLEMQNAQTELRVDTDVTATIGVGLVGASDIVKTGYGTVVFSGAQTYNGNTVVQAGTLATRDLINSRVMMQGGVFSPGGNTVQTITVGGLSLDGGQLDFNIGTAGTDRIIVADNAGLLTAATHFHFIDSGTTGGLYTLISGLETDWNLSLLSFSGMSTPFSTLLLSADGTELLLSVFEGGMISGPVLQNSSPVGTPTIADFLVNGIVNTGTPDESNRVNSLLFNPHSALHVFNNLTVGSGNFTVNNGSATMTGGNVLVPGIFNKLGGGLLNIFSNVFVNGPANVVGVRCL